MTDSDTNKTLFAKGSLPGMFRPDDDEIDLLALLSVLLEYRWFIAGVSMAFLLLGIAYGQLSTPIYRANALLQVESKKAGLVGLEEMSEMFSQTSEASTEVEIIKSRMVVGKAVDRLKLDLHTEFTYFPLFGERIARSYKSAENNEEASPVAPAKFGLTSYNWGGAAVDVFQLDVPDYLIGEKLLLVAEGKQAFSLYHEDELLLKGKVGDYLEQNGITLQIKSLQANPGTEIVLGKSNRLHTILAYKSRLQASEKGKQTGMISLTFEHPSPAFAESLLNEVARAYVQQNVDRTSAEAANSLEFLHAQLPKVRKDMEKAEVALNQYQISSRSADIVIETQSILEQVVQLDTKLSALQLEKIQMDKLYTKAHPLYQTLMDKIRSVEDEKRKLESKIEGLPETQQELLRLRRDVEVSSQIYTELLQKAQELDIARASTVGNVRIIDLAEVDRRNPVAPRKAIIALMALMLGGMLSVALALLYNFLRRGVESPGEIEAMDLPVYASVPFSEVHYADHRRSQETNSIIPTLAHSHPKDPAIEALRSLHTSLHFAMLEANNKTIMISGPSPQVGKSFVSINLASLMVDAGKKVLLIDADMRKGYLHKYFDLQAADKGLSDLLTKQASANEVIRHSDQENLHYISRGTLPPNPSELLLKSGFAEVMEALAKDYDLVLIDTPPILAVADAIAVAKIASASFVVARFGETKADEIRACIRNFEQNGISLNGAILNATRKKLLNYYNYQKYGYGYYHYNYSHESKEGKSN